MRRGTRAAYPYRRRARYDTVPGMDHLPPDSPERRVPRSRATLRFVLSIAVALAAVAALYLFSPGLFSGPVTATPRVPPRATPTPVPPPPRFPDIGEAHRVDNVVIQLVGVQYTRGNGANEANQGDTYAIVTLRIENERGQDYTFVPNVTCLLPYCNFYILDRQGEKNPPIHFDPYHTGLRAVVLQNGGYQVGSYTFEVPERDVKSHTLQLLYYHDPLGDANNVAHWLLKEEAAHG